MIKLLEIAKWKNTSNIFNNSIPYQEILQIFDIVADRDLRKNG